MTRYLLSVYQPDGAPPADVDLDRIKRDVMALREDLTLSRLLLVCIPVLAGSLGVIISRMIPKFRAMQPKIDAWFAHDRMQDIAAGLQRDGSELAQSTLKTLNEKSPRGMVVALKLLRLARRSSSLQECLVREYRAALQVFASDDFREGVRAAVIDKDRSPRWSPPRIEDVTTEMVAPYFAEIGADELVFH